MLCARLPLLYGIGDVNAKTKGAFQPALLIWESVVTGRKSAAHKDVCQGRRNAPARKERGIWRASRHKRPVFEEGLRTFQNSPQA